MIDKNSVLKCIACALIALFVSEVSFARGVNPNYKKWIRRVCEKGSETNNMSSSTAPMRKTARSFSGTDQSGNIVDQVGNLERISSDVNYGYKPSLIDYRYLNIANIRSPKLCVGDSLPPKYDSRDYGWVSSVKNQNPFGTCWAHAAIGAIEVTLRRENEGTFTTVGQPDLSENNMVMQKGYDIHPYGSADLLTNVPSEYTAGGFFEEAFAYLGRWSDPALGGGPIFESEDVYPSAANNYSTHGSNVHRAPAYHVQEYIKYPPKTKALDHDEIKDAIRRYGSVWVSYCATESDRANVNGTIYTFPYISSDRKSFYHCSSVLFGEKDASNHAVLLIGWDDNYPKENFIFRSSPSGYVTKAPPGDGAYLIKNSWGANEFDEGFLWVSYYDDNMLYDESYVVPTVEKKDNFSEIYQYDPLGLVYTFPDSDYKWGANVFTAVNSASIAAVGFYSMARDTSYTIQIYTGCSDGNPVSGTCRTGGGKKGVVPFAGYTTVMLDSPITITAGQRFSVVLGLNSPGCEEPFGAEVNLTYKTDWWSIYSGLKKFSYSLTSGAKASAGQSFVSKNGVSGTWRDITTEISPICVEKEGYFLTIGGVNYFDEVMFDTTSANLCIKAYAQAQVADKELKSIEITGTETSIIAGGKINLTCTAKYNNAPTKVVTDASEWSIVKGYGDDIANVVSPGVIETATNIEETRLVRVQTTYEEDGVSKSDTWDFNVSVAPPTAPIDLSATQGTDASCVRVSWTPSRGATEYRIYRSATNNKSNAKYIDKVTVAKYNDDPSATGLIPGVDYWYFVKAWNKSGLSDSSEGVSGWCALSAPTDVTASDGKSAECVEVKWSEVVGAKTYHVYRLDVEDIENEMIAIGSWQSETSYQDKTAAPNKTYRYYVRAAIDSQGTRASECSVFDEGYIAVPVTLDYLTISGEPNIPSGGDATYACMATYTDKSTRSVARPSWSIIAGGDYATVDSTGKVTAGIVTANQTVTLQASYTDGVNRKATKDITIAAVKPSAPASVVLKSASTEAVTISWSSVADAAGYSVWRGSSTADAKKIADVDAETAEYADNSGVPGVSYTYWVKASNAAGESGFSVSSVTATLGLAEPTGVAATDGTYTDKTLVSWKPTIGASHYRVARAGSMTGSKTELGNWQAGTSYEDKSGTAGTHYWYFVKAATGSDGANASAYSAGDEGWRKVAVTLSSIEISGATKLAAGGSTVFSCVAKYTSGSSKTVKPNWSVSPESAATIDADGKLMAKNVTDNVKVTVTAEFTDGVTKTDTHEVLIVAPIVSSAEVKNVKAKTRWPFSSLLDVDYELVTQPAGTRALVTLSGHDDDKGVAMAARSLTGDGATGPVEAGKHRLTWDVAADYPDFHTTSFSVEMSAVAMSANMPSNVTASAGTSAEGVDIAWAAIDDATGYEVWRNTDSATNGAERIQTTDQVSYTDTDAVAGTTYWYWVRSVTEDGTSDFGKPVSGWRAYADITVAFNPNGGSASSTSKTYSPTKAYGSLPTASRTGYDFDGWYTASSGGTKVTTSSTVPMANTTLWAHWTAHTYTIRFNANGGSGSMSDLAMTYDVAKNLTANAFTKSGNNFKGWATSAGGSVAYTDGSSVKNLTAGNGATITLFAVWEANVPAVSLAEAVDNTDLVFTTGGAANWTVDTAVSYTGGSSARSGVISHNQSTWIKTTLTGAGRVSFRWNASCENPFDKATFAVDGVTKAQTSSTNGWLLVEQEVTGTGTHELTWTYAKDSSMSSGSDCVWLDAVTFVESSSSLPSSFDLRTTGRVTPVKSVGDYSTCWAFDAIAALESTMKTSSGIAYDLSENNMINLAGFDYGFNDGGMFDMATAYLLRWDGPVLESEDSYPSIGTSVRSTPAFHVQNIIDLPGKSSSLDHEHVKQAVFDHGGVYATFNFQNSYYNTATRSYRMPSAQSASHNSTGVIVGWDDSYSRTKFLVPPTGDGAYIVRMSYGSSWGENGYMYVSYYDALFATAMMHVVQGESASRYTRNYQYDPLGHTASVGCSYGANMFTAVATESLAAVGVYVLGANAVYDIKVRVGCAAGNPLSGQLAHSQTARFEYGGFYTVPFTTPVPVTSGERFSVVVSMSVPGCDYPMAIEYAIAGFTSGATAAAGQSFYSANGVTWSDLTGLAATANFCCKVYAQGGSTAPTAPTNVSATDGAYPDKVVVSWSSVDGAESYSIYRSASSNSESATLVGSTSATSYVDTDVSQGVVYYYWVRSVQGGVASTWSESASGRSVAPPAPVLTLADAVENADITLTTGGGANWTIDTTAGYSGGNSARSGTVGDLQSSWMETVVNGPGTFSFRWKVSSEEEYDIFTWTLDGVEQGEISGETDWALVTKELTTGSHTIRWIYTKDEDGGDGSDCGWVDVVEVPILPPTNVSAGDGAATASVKILWSATPGATGYTVWRGETGDATQAEQVGTSTSTSYTDKSGTPGQTYYYWVTATDGMRTSVFSASDTGYRALAAPTNIAASDNTLACGVCVTWDAVEGADGYAVYRGTTSTSDSATQIATSMGPAYVDVEVAADTKSYYFIKATRGDKASAFSAYDKGTRKAGMPLYVVVDLSGGTTAVNYPISELMEDPTGDWTDEYKTDKLVLRWIANGSYTMGCESMEVGYTGDEAQPHQVTISKPFYMGVFEVTQKQFELVMGSKPSYFSNALCYATRPVEKVSYNMIRGSSEGSKWPSANSVDSTSFMGKIRAKTGLTFDLPTEAQWEYACRAGTTTALNSGKNLTSTSQDPNINEVGRYLYNFPCGSTSYFESSDLTAGTAAVGSYKPNNWRVYDMHGNVSEWCLDWYVSRGTSGFDTSVTTDPKGNASGSDRVLRGGSLYSNGANLCRSARRFGSSPSRGEIGRGFRLCCPAGLLSDQVTVSFDANGGLGAMAAVTTGKGGSFAIPKVTFTRTGHTFQGWATSSSGSIVYSDGATIASMSAGLALFAKWTANTYTVTLNKNGGTCTDLTSYTYGVGATLPIPTKTGHTFGGWYTSSTFAGSAVTAISKSDLEAKTYYAKWTANTYTVTLNKNGGTCTDLTSYTYGVGATLPAPTKTGHTFGGWYTSSSCTGSAVTQIATTDTGAKSFYAKWTVASYAVTLNKDGGTCSDLTSYTYGIGATLPTPTKTDYVFGGWFETSNFSGTSFTKILASDVGEKVFYAKWEERVPQSATFSGQPPSFEVLNGPDGVLLQISRVPESWWSGCNYRAYKIYHSTSSDQSTATLLATVMASATNSQGVACYTNMATSVGVKQWYWVVGYRANRTIDLASMLQGGTARYTYSNIAYTSFPSAVLGYRRPPDPAAPTVTRSGNQIAVSWAAVAGADQYAVYRVFAPSDGLARNLWFLTNSGAAEKGFTKEATNIGDYYRITTGLSITDTYEGDNIPYYYIRAMKNGTFSNRSARK